MVQTTRDKTKIAAEVDKRPCLGPAFGDLGCGHLHLPTKNQRVKITDQITGFPNHQCST